jgi:hypothetical protein
VSRALYAIALAVLALAWAVLATAPRYRFLDAGGSGLLRGDLRTGCLEGYSSGSALLEDGWEAFPGQAACPP